MLSKRIRFLIAVVLTSLVGMILLQVYWLHVAYGYTSEQLKAQIAQVLESLQREHAISEMRGLGILPSSLKLPLKPADFSLLAFMQSSASTMSFVQPSGINKIVKLSSGHLYPADELKARSVALELELDSLFQRNRIDVQFKCLVFNVNTSENIKPVPDMFTKYQVRIGLTKPFLLQVNIEKDNSVVLKRLWWTLLSSIVIIGCTVLAFMFMFLTIFRQRKLSTIKNDFINNMTHEFKTPLSTVSLAVEAIKSFYMSSQHDRTIEYLDICQHELKKMGNIIENVLGFEALERGYTGTFREASDLNLLISDVLSSMRLPFEERMAEVEFSPADQELYCLIDYTQISSVFYNLLDNSIKYSQGHLVIKVICRREHKFAEFNVCDNGIGIPETDRDQVFDSFYRVSSGNLHQIKGFGLGLSYASEIVKAHGGVISLSSEKGHGTSFCIRLPLIETKDLI